VGVFSAEWTLLTCTPSWAALIGDPSGRSVQQRNLVRSVFTTGTNGLASWPVRQDDEEALPAALVADLRSALVDHPNDPGLAALLHDLHTTGPHFAQLWDRGAVGRHVSARKTIEHPAVGDVTCDCDVLTVPDSSLRIVIYTVATGSPDAEKLDFLRVTRGVATTPTA
jgi:MmyB-like transcription regulator ligand binding domain